MPIPQSQQIALSSEVKQRLRDLHTDYQDGDITKKGYCKKKWEILRSIVPISFKEKVEDIKKRFDDGKMSADAYHDQVLSTLDEMTSTSMDVDKVDLVKDSSVPVRLDLETDGALSCCVNERISPQKVEDEEMDSIHRCFDKSSAKSVTRRSLRSSSDANNSISPKSNGQCKGSNKKKPISISQAKEQPTIVSLFRNGKVKSNENGKIKDEIEPMEVDSLDIKEEQDEILESREESEGKDKKPKLSDDSISEHAGQKLEKTKVIAKDLAIPPRCTVCKQLLHNNPDLLMYGGHPRDAVDEEVALVDPRLSLFTGDEVDEIDTFDERPQNKITGFSVFDQEGHLCPFDTGLIEKNVLLYFSGYLKAIYEENKDIEGGIPVKDLGPINEWWVSGFDGGESALIGFSTGFGEYFLMEPSPEYAPIMNALKEKIFMSKVVIEFLCGARGNGGDTYEDLINTLQTTVPPENIPSLTEDGLLRHAQFICDRVLSFDSVEIGDQEAGSSEMQDSLLTTPCMRSLINLAGVSFGKRQNVRRGLRKEMQVKKKIQWTKATTTLLVKEVFEIFFREQIQSENDVKVKVQKRQRCGICEACQQPDCGVCNACKDMIKFGGTGRSKQACNLRKCPNMAIQEAEDSDPEDEDSYQKLAEAKNDCLSPVKKVRSHLTGSKKNITWIGDPIFKNDVKTYYREALVEGVGKVELGSHVLVQPKDPSTPYFVARINCMWGDVNDRRMFHAIWYCRGSETVLGETADPTELFCIDECEDVSLRAIAKKVKVLQYHHPENWSNLGGVVDGTEIRKYFESMGKCEENEEILWFQKRYDKIYGRFEDLADDPPCAKPGSEYRFCPSCERLYLHQNSQMPRVDEKLEYKIKNEVYYGVVHYRKQEYRSGTFIYIDPTKVSWTYESSEKDTKKKEKQSYEDANVDEEMYPEYYRKYANTGDEKERNVKGSNMETPTPFIIGMITDIKAKQSVFNGDPRFVSASDIMLDIKIFFRPEETHKGLMATYQADLNLLYWTGIKHTVAFKSVVGQCHVVYGENVEGSADAVNPRHWSTLGPNRFYFLQAYDYHTKTFSDPPEEARSIGKLSKGKGKGKGKGKKEKDDDSKALKIEEWPSISCPLKSLDVFAGCGGLSDGLHQSGVATTEWAIEKDEAAANAFKLNNPNCTVFTDDCNDLLRLVMDGEKVNKSGQKLPLKGEVELLCGGPPCQGFSGMNRFNSRQYSLFKNSLIASYLSYCDYYRPRFFILENVRNFVSFKKNMVLKLTLRCLLRMGYQCSFAVLQAGNYGVPQTRRRAIIFAAAPGEVLPKYPSPTHAFSPKACKLSVMVDDKRFDPDFPTSAPFRTITVRDAMSDLPEIRNGSKKEEMSYGGEPLSHFQRKLRGNQEILKDHICKEMAPIVEARMAHIPTASGSDWRDLPNIVVRLCDGNYTKKLVYSHDDKKNGRGVNGALRGVCACATGNPCDPMDRQFNTLIPWCLPHTGNRHNHWAGLYGRLEWEGFFSTTITNPEPMGKQGRVLHPEQTRVVSVRECARSQGFKDNYRFYGNILDKHRQVGNAVPPPLGAAIGHEIRKSVSLKEQTLQENYS